MEYLQYIKKNGLILATIMCFKPYYKWNTFNTEKNFFNVQYGYSFKPYYKWNTFNTEDIENQGLTYFGF